MKLLPLLIILFIAASCQNNKPAAPASALNDALAKVKSFSFVNTDSIKYYDSVLNTHINKNIPVHNGIKKYADGLYFITVGLNNKAVVNFQEAAVIFAAAKNDSMLAYAYLALGNCNKMNGDEDEAVGSYLKALTLFEKLKDNRYIRICNANLADNYLQKNDTVNARRYLDAAKNQEPPGTKIYLSLLHFQANMLGMTGKIDSAMQTDYAGISMANNNGFPDKLSPFYDNLARCFMEKKNYDSAEFYYKKCIAADSSNGRLQLMADTYAQLVNLYGIKNEPAKMMAIAHHATSLSDSTQYLRGKLAIFDGLNNYYTRTEQWQKLATVKDSLQRINKQLLNEESIAKTAEYSVEYETSKKEALITKQQNDLQQARKLIVFAVVVAVLGLLFAISLYRNYKTKRLMAVNAAVQQQKDANINAIFETEQTERIRIARDLHDSIGQKLSVLKMFLHNRANDAEKSPALLDETIQEVRNISHNLLPEELNFGFINAVKSDIEKLNDTETFNINTVVEEADYNRLSLLTSLNILRIFRELMANMVKHSKATEILVHISIVDNNFHLHIQDNGVGLSPEAIEASSGIGWKNIYARINMLKGNIDINKEPDAGTALHIKIPL